jgi:hypothetical protein
MPWPDGQFCRLPGDDEWIEAFASLNIMGTSVCRAVTRERYIIIDVSPPSKQIRHTMPLALLLKMVLQEE